jgi:DNA-binding NarL/FixJ family response regulator
MSGITTMDLPGRTDRGQQVNSTPGGAGYMVKLTDNSTELNDSGIKVLILEEQEVIRHGLLAIASSIPEITAQVMAIDAVCDEEPSRFDATLLSTSMLAEAERAGICLEHLRPMIVIVPTTQPQQLEIVTRRPANGYIIQAELTSNSLRSAVFQVINGQFAIPAVIASYLLNRVRQDSVPRPRLESLSSREAEVLRMLVAGASNKEIARKLGISVHGVKRHVSMLLIQFHSPNRVHLVSYVLQSGFLT